MPKNSNLVNLFLLFSVFLMVFCSAMLSDTVNDVNKSEKEKKIKRNTKMFAYTRCFQSKRTINNYERENSIIHCNLVAGDWSTCKRKKREGFTMDCQCIKRKGESLTIDCRCIKVCMARKRSLLKGIFSCK